MMRLVRLALMVVVVVMAVAAVRFLWMASAEPAAGPAAPAEVAEEPGALAGPAEGPGDVKPVPQDHEKMKKQFEERLAWNRKTLGEAYEKVGKRSPKWDEAALKALDVAAKAFSEQYEPLVQIDQAYGPAKQAMEAGCDDPMVLYLYLRSMTAAHNVGEKEIRRLMEKAAKGLEESGYAPERKAAALLRAAALKVAGTATDEQKAEAQEQIDKALEQAETGAEGERIDGDQEKQWYGILTVSIALQRQLEPDALKAFQRIEKKVEGVKGLEAVWQTVKGNFFYTWGWEARGQRFASGVTDEQFRTFDERLAEARKALEEAWRLKPGTYHVATLMVDVEKSVGNGDRAEMEKWFERAMESDGDDYAACLSKLDWLDPKWHGDGYDEMIAFGRACASTENWHTGIILLGASSHYRYVSRLSPQQAGEYLGGPKVWPEIESAYKVYLKHFPSNHSQRSKYAAMCALSGHVGESHAQFEILGKNLTTWPDFPNLPLGRLKLIRATSALEVMVNPKSR